MKILLEVRHPHQVHCFSNFYSIMKKRGHQIKIGAVDKEMTLYLLAKLGMPFSRIGRNRRGFMQKLIQILLSDLLSFKNAMDFVPDIFVGRASPSLAHISFLMRKPYVAFSDTEHAKLTWKTILPFMSHVLTPTYFLDDLGETHLRFPGFFELCYLHPNYFKPNISVLDDLGVELNEKYVILRFVSWSAAHDLGQKGFDPLSKRNLVYSLSKLARVFVSSEERLPDDLLPYQISIPAERIHDALAFSTLYVGEGATMASEAALLGTPAIYLNSLTAGTIERLAELGLLFSYRTAHGVLEKAIELLKTEKIKEIWRKKQESTLSEQIDVTQFMVWFIEKYPFSVTFFKGKGVDAEYFSRELFPVSKLIA